MIGTLAALFLGACHKHHNQEIDAVVVHVYRDPLSPYSAMLVQATRQFVSGRPHAGTGRKLMISLSASPYTADLPNLSDIHPQIVILNTDADIAQDAPVRSHLGDSQPVCGAHPAYLPDWNSPEERDTALMYLQFLRDHCSPPIAPPASAPSGASPDASPSGASPSTPPAGMDTPNPQQ